jgi:Xaa-Pro aminopeptidase
MPPSNPAQENWTGHILTADEGRQISGIQEIWDARNFETFLATLIPQAKDVLPPAAAKSAPAIPVDVSKEFAQTIDAVSDKSAELYMLGGRPRNTGGKLNSQKLAAAYPGLTIKNPAQMFNNMRAVKSAREIDC